MSVMMFHLHASLEYNGTVPSPIEQTSLAMVMLSKRGVYLFFAISGFILGTPFAQMHIHGGEPVNLKTYFRRRLTRLEPPYVVCMILCAIAEMLDGKFTFKEVLPHLLAGLGYVHAILYNHQVLNPINPVTWSLEVEIQFYILVPLLTAIYALHNKIARRATLVACVLTSSLCSLPLISFPLRIVYGAPFFLAGLLIADVYSEYGSSWEGTRSYIWDGVALIGWPLVWILAEPAAHITLPLLFVILIVGAFRGRIMSRLLSLSFITAIGGMCYSIYLFHDKIITTLGRITKPLDFGTHSYFLYLFLKSALIFPMVLVICGLFFVLVERPCMDPRWPQKLVFAIQSRVERKNPVSVE